MIAHAQISGLPRVIGEGRLRARVAAKRRDPGFELRQVDIQVRQRVRLDLGRRITQGLPLWDLGDRVPAHPPEPGQRAVQRSL